MANSRAWYVLADPGSYRPWRAETGGSTASGEWRLSSIVVGYGNETDEYWLRVGTFYRVDRDILEAHFADRLGTSAAECGDGEAAWNRDAMLARIARCQGEASRWTETSLTVDGHVVPARRSTVGAHRLVYAIVDGVTVFVQTRDWTGPADVVRTRDLATLTVLAEDELNGL